MSTAIEVAVHLFQRRGVEAVRVCLTTYHAGLDLSNKIRSDGAGLREFHRALQSLVLFLNNKAYCARIREEGRFDAKHVEDNKRSR